jgi:hypothetical protein
MTATCHFYEYLIIIVDQIPWADGLHARPAGAERPGDVRPASRLRGRGPVDGQTSVHGTGVDVRAAEPWTTPGWWGLTGGSGTTADVDPALESCRY